MKKTLTAAITTALVIGAASTTFAAANPFTDVPTGHWSYDAVAKLAQDGVIEGYGDGTFRGDKAITRYEMAQMVAKAMAKSDVSAADKAAIDKLAAEYSAELNNLGVRVGELENKVDNVKWGGKARFRSENTDVKDDGTKNEYASKSYGHSYIDLWATAKINDGWNVKAEFEGEHNMRTGSGDIDTENTSKVFAQGKLFGADATIGKFGAFSKDGFVIDKAVSGAQFKFGNELKTTLTTGRLAKGVFTSNASDVAAHYEKVTSLAAGTASGADYSAIELSYAISKDTSINAGYHQVTSEDFRTGQRFGSDDNKLGIWEVGFNTKFGQDWSLDANYVKGNQDKLNVMGTTYDAEDTGYFTQLQYKAADVKKEGSYDVFVNYRKVPFNTQIAQTWGDFAANNKGWTIGFDYVPAENINFQAFYFDGKDVDDSNQKTKFVRAQVELFF